MFTTAVEQKKKQKSFHESLNWGNISSAIELL